MGKKRSTEHIPTVSIKEFRATQYKGLVMAVALQDLPPAPWIFVTGENGFGKTIILQALAAYLTPIARSHKQPEDTVEITFHGTGNTLNTTEEQVEVLGYGSSRLQIQGDGVEFRPGGDIDSLFKDFTVLQSAEVALKKYYDRKNSKDDAIAQEYSGRYDALKTLLEAVLLNVYEIEPKPIEDAVHYIETDKQTNEKLPPLTFNQLSAGYRSVIALVGDLFLRLEDHQHKNKKAPSRFRNAGIVLIDELELHLHPKWQRKLPELLSRAFPHIQFIASTHSPMPLLGAPEGSVFLTVHRTANEGIVAERLTEVELLLKDKSLLPNTLLSSPQFGFTDIFTENMPQENKVPLRTERLYDERLFNDWVAEQLGKVDPERIRRLRALLKTKSA